MSFSKWIARVGGPGSAARWAAKAYRKIRAGHPDWATVRDIEIFRLIVASRYAVLPHARAQAFLEEWMSNENQGLERVVLGVLMAEHGWNALEFPQIFREVVHEELAKSGLPDSVIFGKPSDNNPSAPERISRRIGILLAVGDDDLALYFADAAKSAIPANTIVDVLIPVTVHDSDLWVLAKEQDWDLAILQINNILYSSSACSQDSLQEESVKFVRKIASEFAKPIICSYPLSSWATAEYLQQLFKAGARALIQIPCTTDVIRETVKQCLSIR